MIPADVPLIEHIQQATQGSCRLLCTLAKRGKALERDEPQRADLLLCAIRPHPLYKGGRLTFDMLELEDLMLDAPLIDLLDDLQLIELLGAADWRDLVRTLLRFGSDRVEYSGNHSTEVAGGPSVCDLTGRIGADTDVPAAAVLLPSVRFGPTNVPLVARAESPANSNGEKVIKCWPELLSSDYLYDYVVLGLLDLMPVVIRSF